LKNAVEKKETIEFQHIKIFLTGSSAVGKTSFRRSLFAEKFVEEYESTELQETKHAYVASILESTDGDVKWLELTAKEQIDHFKSLLEQRRAEQLANESDVSSDVSKSTKNNLKVIEKLNSSKGLAPDLVIPDPVKLITVVDTGGQPEFINMLPAIVNCPTINFVVINMAKKLKDVVEVHYKAKEDKVKKEKVKQETVKNENKVKVEVYYKVQEEEKVKNDDKVEIVHYKVKESNVKEKRLKTEDKVNVEVNYKIKEKDKVKKEDKLKVEVHYEGKKHKKPISYLSYTNEDLIKLLMSITYDSLNLPVIQKQKSLGPNEQPDGEVESYIGFVGTHKDETDLKTINELDGQLESLVGTQKCFLVPSNYKCLYPINNTVSESNGDDEVIAIRKEIERVTENMKRDPVPISWMILEIEVKSFCEVNSQSYVTMNKFSEIARTEASIKTQKDVDAVLWHFHSLGIFLHFQDVPEMREYVITDHQWFYNTLCKLVGLSSDSSLIVGRDHLEFKKSGLLLKNKLLNMKWGEKIKIESLVALLRNMKILAYCKKDKKEFCYIPYILPHCHQYHDKYKYLLLEPLLVRFSSGSLPRGFFCSLVVQLLEELPCESCKWDKVDFNNNYRNVITFNVNDGELYLRLQDKIYYLEVQVRHFEHCMKRCMSQELKSLCNYLHKVCENLNFDSDKLEYGFLCHSDTMEDDHMVVLDSLENPSYLKQCEMKECKKKNEMGPLHDIWFKEVSFNMYMYI